MSEGVGSQKMVLDSGADHKLKRQSCNHLQRNKYVGRLLFY
jgi:hypothetical protein